VCTGMYHGFNGVNSITVGNLSTYMDSIRFLTRGKEGAAAAKRRDTKANAMTTVTAKMRFHSTLSLG